MYGLIVALTGGSGIIYALRLLEYIDLLYRKYSEVHVALTRGALRVAEIELGIDDLAGYIGDNYKVDGVHLEDEWDSFMASSSGLVGYEMVIVPASLNTVAKLASGIQDNVVLRAASSILRLKNKLVVVVRETPLSAIDLYNLYKLASAGAVILPASPAFYHKPEKIEDLIDFITGKILDTLGIKNQLYTHWNNMDKYRRNNIVG